MRPPLSFRSKKYANVGQIAAQSYFRDVSYIYRTKFFELFFWQNFPAELSPVAFSFPSLSKYQYSALLLTTAARRC